MRNHVFWLLDFLKGAPIRKHYREIEAVNENPNSDISKQKLAETLKALLQHCINTVPFYKDLSEANLKDFPVVDKNLIRENIDAFQSRAYDDKKKIEVRTSGSTGTPFKVWQNGDKKKRNSADVIYFSEKAGYALGNRLFFMRIWEKSNTISRLKNMFQNLIPVDVTNFQPKHIVQVLKSISETNGDVVLLGYPSVIEILTNHIDASKNPFTFKNVKTAITIGEALQKNTAESIRRHFNCEVFSRYSNNENGIMAQQVPKTGDYFMLNCASYHFEILDFEKDMPLAEGEPGRIVVTDLYNICMPLVRYDTGDVGIKKTIMCENKRIQVFSLIEGRRIDTVFDTSGNIISSFLFGNRMRQYLNIKQFQFVQLSKKTYEFILIVNDGFNKEKQLVEEFKQYLGYDAKITLRYTAEIPMLSSGKRKKVVNKWRNSHSKP